MKRILPLLLMALLLLPILSGCNRGSALSMPVETQIPYAFDYERLWTFDPGLSGYIRSGAAHHITWDNGDVDLDWSRCPVEFGVSNHFNSEKRVENGVTYYFSESELAWDSTDVNQKWVSGSSFTRKVDFEQDGSRCRLAASASKTGISLEMASINTALALAGHPGLMLPGFGKTMEGWQTGFQNGNLNLSISISPPPFDQQEIDQYLAEGGYVLMTAEDGLPYISSGRDRTAADPMIAFLFVKTEIGTVSVRGGVPNLKRDTVPADSLDYIDLDLVRAVVAWVKGN